MPKEIKSFKCTMSFTYLPENIPVVEKVEFFVSGIFILIKFTMQGRMEFYDYRM